MVYIISIMRFIAPAAAIVILLTCIISLFRNRPRVHKLAKLINQADGKEIEIRHWETSIGKSKSNDIVLPYPHVSRFHAVIAKKRRDWVITDTSVKTTGVAINGKKIEGRQVIENGDTIMIGDIPLKFVCDEAISATTRTQLRNSIAQPQQRNIAYAVLVDVKTRRPVYIKSQNVLIGRADNCDIQIKNNTISANHARIHKTSRGWAISDLDSHNGTKLNGRYINQPQLIFDEDMLTFGDRVFIFYEH